MPGLLHLCQPALPCLNSDFFQRQLSAVPHTGYKPSKKHLQLELGFCERQLQDGL
jgi:hypothetical protein